MMFSNKIWSWSMIGYCNTHCITGVLNDNKEETDDNTQNIQKPCNRTKQGALGEGKILSTDQRINAQFFKQNIKTKRHIQTNKHHLETCVLDQVYLRIPHK
eukprot:148880_1